MRHECVWVLFASAVVLQAASSCLLASTAPCRGLYRSCITAAIMSKVSGRLESTDCLASPTVNQDWQEGEKKGEAHMMRTQGNKCVGEEDHDVMRTFTNSGSPDSHH